ncbi:ATP-binding protein [Lysobacter korlensis]|uniref:histidine kinase n=1 Tax=Lysobacter korlensis TaxID=553636 RepID=A0ABV6RRN2_9GAMM
MQRRLYLRIYLIVLGMVATLQFGLAVAWHMHTDPSLFGRALAGFGRGVDRELQPQLPPALQQVELDEWAMRMNADIALYGADGRLQGESGQQVWPAAIAAAGGPAPVAGDYSLGLSHGRTLAIHPVPQGRLVPGPAGTAGVFAVIALLVGIGCYPLVRGLTRRLERLQRGVEAWDGTDHLPRVAVDGRDEIAALAHSFNGAAQRIEDLLRAQKSLLANASHELRSPLARMRLAIELLPADTTPTLRAEVARNIAELDALVDEVLLTSRLDALGASCLQFERVRLDQLIDELAQGAAVSIDSSATTVDGDPRLLRRMLRNLIENAQRHGRGSVVEITLRGADGGLQVEVCDRGPGIAAAECERIFEPFYRAPGASESDGGVGLGLSLVRQIAQLHRGRASCRPRDGGGSCFQVWLPAAA